MITFLIEKTTNLKPTNISFCVSNLKRIYLNIL